MTSSHRVPPFRSWNSFLTLFSCFLLSDIWELIVGYGEKWNILRSKLEGSLLWNCISMCECNSQSYTFLFSVQFANTLFWKSAMGYFWTQWTFRDEGSIFRWKLERSFVRNILVMCEFISQSYTYVSCSSPLSLFLRNLRRTCLDRMESYAEKGNIISSKRERSFLRNFFMLSEFLSQVYC